MTLIDVSRAAELRREFDASFLEPAEARATDERDLLLIRAGGDAYAVGLSEVAAINANKVVRGVPSRVPELLGVAGFRGALVPVYDLAALLGHPRSSSSRWLMIVAGPSAVALAFQELERHTRVPKSAVGQDDATRARAHLHGVLRVNGDSRPMVHLASIVSSLQTRARQLGQGQEDSPWQRT